MTGQVLSCAIAIQTAYDRVSTIPAEYDIQSALPPLAVDVAHFGVLVRDPDVFLNKLAVYKDQ